MFAFVRCAAQCSILYSVYVVVKVSSSAVPALAQNPRCPTDNGEPTFVFRSAVSGKPRSRGEGRSSLAIFNGNGANAIYRQSAVAVVVVFGSYVSDES